jgi:hypothetical protein
VGGLIDPSDQVFLTKFSKLCRLTNNLIHLADPFQSLLPQFLVAYITSTDGQKRHEPPTMLLRTTTGQRACCDLALIRTPGMQQSGRESNNSANVAGSGVDTRVAEKATASSVDESESGIE